MSKYDIGYGNTIDEAAANAERRTPYRTIEAHKVSPVNDKLTVTVIDEPGPGGANHLYLIEGFDEPPYSRPLRFQCGTLLEVGANGVTHELLLAVIADRLLAFQRGKFACLENAEGLAHIEKALEWLQSRTRRRQQQGIEGTMRPDPVGAR